MSKIIVTETDFCTLVWCDAAGNERTTTHPAAGRLAVEDRPTDKNPENTEKTASISRSGEDIEKRIQDGAPERLRSNFHREEANEAAIRPPGTHQETASCDHWTQSPEEHPAPAVSGG